MKTNLQKYVHPFSLNQLVYRHVQCREPIKVSKRFQFERRQQGFAPLGVIILSPYLRKAHIFFISLGLMDPDVERAASDNV